MARIVSPNWAVIRGSIGGTTYLANQYHQVIARNRTAPVQPNTPHQIGIRNAVSNASTIWKAGVLVNQEAWNAYATTLTYSSPVSKYQVRGRQTWIANRSFLRYLTTVHGLDPAIPYDAPDVPGYYQLSLVSTVSPVSPAAGVGIDFEIVNDFDPLIGVSILLDVSFPFSLSRERYKGPYDPALQTGLQVAQSSSLTYQLRGLTLGARYFYRLRAVTAYPALAPWLQLTPRYFGSFIAETAV